ncbi:PREDICTED: kinesin-like protein KIN-14B isoform X2 [Ipomoea nil]|uniref:kinesin-like protein KIN-14B isoform X2 n=1 Tax=Ipomoea nil TaxID=35883 RepID=UPI000900EA03|nr:PREDICTED: kinesin-like protein KIN-14B isoform X2 [Ipomoea nil]
MSEQKSSGSYNRWSWDVPGFEPRRAAAEHDGQYHPKPPAPLVRRYSISSSSIPSHSELSKHALNSGLLRLKDNLKLVREDYAELRQEASDLQEYSNAKLDRVTRYLGVLADKTRKLDQAALESEARISPLISEKKKLFNDLLTSKGNIQVFCRVRPLFEDEGPSVVEFPDDFTIRVNTGDDSASNPKKDFEFDRVYGPHVGQVELFTDIQPFVQSAFDGYNASIFAYGQTHSGKTHTMEGSSHDRGLYARCFEELFDLSNSDATSTSKFNFSVSVFELYNEQIRDLLLESGGDLPKTGIRLPDCFVELVQEKVENPLDFCRILKVAFQNRGSNTSKFNVTHLIICVHIYYENMITGENFYSKLSLIDLAGSESASVEDDSGGQATDLLHVMNSLSALGDVLNSLTSKKDSVPYGNSMLTKLFADSIGGNAKTVMIVNICPNALNLSETLSSLNFSARARSAVLSLGNRDTIKKWRDIANDARKELYEKEKEINDLKQEVTATKQDLKHANDQCVLLFNEVQKAWKVSFTLQSDLKAENIMLVDKHNIEKEQNSQLRNQVAQLLQLEQEQKMQIKERDSTIQALQTKLKNIELQLNEALSSSEKRSINGSESKPTVQTSSKPTTDNMDSTAVTKRLEEELLKRDALIERLHEENEKLFDRLTEKASLAGSPQVSSPSPKEPTIQSRDMGRNDNNIKGRGVDEVPLPLVSNKSEGTVALVKAGTENIKRTPAGEYLTSALNDFDPEQYDSLAAISDGANKLLMLVLAAVIKAGASREHEILAEIRDAVFAFIRKMEPKRVMDTMLVSRVRILYIRSLLARSPELQSIKILQQMRTDVALFTLEDGGSPVRNPSTAAEDARLASLVSLDGILKQVKDIMRQSSVNSLGRSRKKATLSSLDELAERMPSLLDIDHPCARKQIEEARRIVESIPEEDDRLHDTVNASLNSADAAGSGGETDVAQWNVLQFNTGSTSPFIIKCGANSNSELVIKADARVQEPKGGEIVRVVPRPTVLENMSLEEMKQLFTQLPEALSLLALARTADGTRARYSRLYRTLAMKVPALRDLISELEKGGVLKDMKS